jgi:hypothetical protein
MAAAGHGAVVGAAGAAAHVPHRTARGLGAGALRVRPRSAAESRAGAWDEGHDAYARMALDDLKARLPHTRAHLGLSLFSCRPLGFLCFRASRSS